MTCKCITVKHAVDLAFHGTPIPACPEHDTDPGQPAEAIALNDNRALAKQLGMPLTKENH